MSRVWIPIFLAVIIAFVMVCACIGNLHNLPPVVTPTVTQGIVSSKNPLDLTNQNSPLAAIFMNGASYTPLVTPHLPIRARVNAYIRGFGQDTDHELYILTSMKSGPDPNGTTGEIWRLVSG